MFTTDDIFGVKYGRLKKLLRNFQTELKVVFQERKNIQMTMQCYGYSEI